MEKLIDQLSEIKGVKSVRRLSDDVLRVELFSREIPGSELVEIKGDLRSISGKISSTLGDNVDEGSIDNWNWIEKPRKRYDETSLGDSVTDRKPKGHRPGHYQIEIQN